MLLIGAVFLTLEIANSTIFSRFSYVTLLSREFNGSTQRRHTEVVDPGGCAGYSAIRTLRGWDLGEW
jgi:hypothetical protein